MQALLSKDVLMLIFNSLAHESYGPADKVLKLISRSLDPDLIGPDEIIVQLLLSPIHPGNIFLIENPLPGMDLNLSPSNPGLPGLEGVGLVIHKGSNVNQFKIGQRVAFFPVKGGWSEYVTVNKKYAVAVPDNVSDEVACQMLINPLTALLGLNDLSHPEHILLNAAMSSVARMLGRMAIDRGLQPIRIVRSRKSAAELEKIMPGFPIIDSSQEKWKNKVISSHSDQNLNIAFDGLGGKSANDLAELIDENGSIIAYGNLSGFESADEAILTQKKIHTERVNVLSWPNHDEQRKANDLEIVLELASKHPEIYLVDSFHRIDSFKDALKRFGESGKNGVVVFNFK
jgi:NADPH:quinone reductase-like Zn-dependent oxidoreductase